MDVCIGNDSPPAGSTEVFGGNDSPPAGSTSFPPQEDQAQGAGDDVNHPMDVTLDSSPHAQSTDGSDGDGARPLREAAERTTRTRDARYTNEGGERRSWPRS